MTPTSDDAGKSLMVRPPMTSTRGKVLIVDDDHATTETFAQMLRLEGHEVQTAPDVRTGLDAAHTFAPDAIVVGLRTALTDGLGFICRFRAQERDRVTPIAMVTGDDWPDESAASELDRLGIHLCFKPLWLADLRDLADVLLAAPWGPVNRPRWLESDCAR
jgi:DNA-binding response OmpR family regulator